MLLCRSSSPLSLAAFLGCLLQDLCFQLHHPGMHFVLYLDEGRFGMGSPPLFHLTQNLLAFLQPGLFVHRFFHALLCFQDERILAAFVPAGYALQNFRGHPVQTSILTHESKKDTLKIRI
jgi:hypothetical protein